MAERVELTGPRDGFRFGAWREAPSDARRGGLIVIQEIFGVTDHIRETAAAYAQEGFETLAPSLTRYSLPSRRIVPASFAPCSPRSAT